MTALYAARAAKTLPIHYALYTSNRLGLIFSIGTRIFSQSHILAKQSSPKPSSKKYTPKNAIPETSYSNKTISTTTPSRPEALYKSILFDKSLSKSDPSPASSKPQYPPRPRSRPPPTPSEYKLHRERIKSKYPEGWAPPRTISRDAMEVLRALHASDPVQYRTPVLANKFKISPEAVSRILKSKWRPSPERVAKMIARENLNKDKRIAEKIKMERAEVAKSLEGRLDIVEKAQGKDKLTMK
ncbi:neugrin domain-containing protein [Rhizoctonia solani]|uniref:Required for respiratory growth protein 9, mitochondrial n=1 Tax=Rhizoctonia solani TaxID=456999 RepID=A0A8H8SWM2_9AGAM|nr:neugrin domain-containing protein [Rhizoctonia solani]QRW19348.1 neugrin domain-containing protein [Rhizoctonia solani]